MGLNIVDLLNHDTILVSEPALIRLTEVLGIASSVGITRFGIVAQPPSEEQ